MTRGDILVGYDVLDTPAEQSFDDIAAIAAQVCGAPIALVSLLDAERQWFKAHHGLEARETPIEQSICRLEIDAPRQLTIPDLTVDPRTRDNPLVTGEPGLRFYAGAPLLAANGMAVGRLCVVDRVPRPGGLSAAQERALSALARQVVLQLEQRRAARTTAKLTRLQACLIEVGEWIRESSDAADMTYGVAEIVGRALNAQRAGFGRVDPETEYVVIEPDWTAPGVASIAGTYRFADFGQIRNELASGQPLVIDDVTRDPRTAADPAAMLGIGIGAIVNIPVRARGRTEAVLIVHFAAAHHWTPAELSFLRTVADRLEAGVARYRAEQQQETLNHELSHRMKNMLAMIQAIASQTLGKVGDREPVLEFERRLQAFSSAHDVLMQSSWVGAGLESVIDGVLAPFGYEHRVDVAGPPVELGPRAALSLALLVHELMTNAMKYGALSVERGRVGIAWGVDASAGEPQLRLSWREQGGPPVVAPTRKGFGSKLIRLGLLGTGGVSVRYQHLGFEADMTAPMSELGQS